MADLLAVKAGEILLIQCKVGGKMRTNDRRSLLALASQAGGRALVAMLVADGAIAFAELVRGRKRMSKVGL